MPWLMDKAEKALEKQFLARTLLDCKHKVFCLVARIRV